MFDYYVYILTNKAHGTLYIGVTNNLIKRIWEHRQGDAKGFTVKYKLHMLVYYEITTDIQSAIAREKQLKDWHRDWKINLIKSVNPHLHDLYDAVCGVDAETSSA